MSRLSKLNDVQNVRSPLDPGDTGQIAPGGHAALVEFEIRGDPDKAIDKIGPVLDSVDDLQAAHPAVFVGEFGDASKVDALVTAYGDDLEKAGMLSLPITLIILVLAFGALVAAGIPLLLALTAVFATFGLIALPSAIFPVAMQAPALVLLIGLAVGVDYSMFYLKREREERAAGRSEQAALEAAAATSGRSVLISGLTVMVAMAGMFLTGDQIFASLGVAAITVVAIAMLGSLTVLPALLSRLGDRVDRARVPLVGRLPKRDGEGRVWGAIVDRVLRRPLVSAVVAGGLLVALRRAGAPAPHGYAGARHVPAVAPRRAGVHQDAAGVPGHGIARQRRRPGAERERSDRPGGDPPARAAGPRQRPHARADHGRRQHGCDRRERLDPDRRQDDRPRSGGCASGASRRDRPEHGGRAAGRRGRRHRARRHSGRTAPPR